jgi:hypothetical protein
MPPTVAAECLYDLEIIMKILLSPIGACAIMELMRGAAVVHCLVLGILMHIEKDPQVHGYRCSFHPEVFQGIDFHGKREVC